MLRLAIGVFFLQTGFHGFTASLPLALAAAAVSDPEIGIVMGSASLVMIPAAFAGGAFVDRYGGSSLLIAGAVAYTASALILLIPGVEPGEGSLPFLASRVCGGVGLAVVMPSALSLVPRMAAASRQGFALSVVGSSQNLALIVAPALSLVILDVAGLDGVAVTVLVGSWVGALLTRRLPYRRADDRAARVERGLRLTIRRSWLAPLAIIVLYVAHWGAVTAYLPQRAEAAGADIGLFFVADGVGILLFRIPAGWLSDRLSTRFLAPVGISMSIVGLLLLIPTPTTPILLVSGFLGGAGGALVLTPMLVEMSRRSTDANRGSAFSLFAGALATAIALGSIGFAPFIESAGFETAMIVGICAALVAAAIALLEPGLRSASRRLSPATTTPPG
jgi:predicted MFS family arabinose efflux permease